MPHRIDVVYRADDESDKARAARAHALREADERARALRSMEGLSESKWRRLSQWAVPNREINAHDVDAFRGVVDTAEDEKPIQLFLQERPHLLATVLGGAQGRWVAPQVRLGGHYVADFFVADADSSGVRWLLVELESPRVPALLQGGQWAKETRYAMHQIEQWRHYLRENPDAARKRREDEGLGLVDIEAGVPGLILISRRSLVAGDPEWMRRSSRLNSGVDIHTFDWLIEKVEGAANIRPQLSGTSRS